jgi:hypothetical protein
MQTRSDARKRLTRMAVLAVSITATFGVTPHLAAQSVPTFTENFRNIKLLAAQGTGYYVNFKEPFGQQCMYDVAYISAEKKGLYATLLAAHLAGKRIHRISYQQPGGNGAICNLDQVELDAG